MGLVNEGELDILRVYFKGASAPSAFYLGLAYGSVEDIGEDATLSDINEVNVSGYSRQEITLSDPETDTEGHGIIANAEAIEFGPFEEDLPEEVGVGFLTDVASGTEGKLILVAALSNPWQAPAHGIFRFPAGNLKFKLD